jgi:hypothetical protein
MTGGMSCLSNAHHELDHFCCCALLAYYQHHPSPPKQFGVTQMTNQINDNVSISKDVMANQSAHEGLGGQILGNNQGALAAARNMEQSNSAGALAYLHPMSIDQRATERVIMSEASNENPASPPSAAAPAGEGTPAPEYGHKQIGVPDDPFQRMLDHDDSILQAVRRGENSEMKRLQERHRSGGV